VELDSILSEIKADLPDFVAGAITGVDGLTISSLSMDENMNMEAIGAEFASIVSTISNIGIDLGAGNIKSSIFTMDKYQILTSQICSTGFFQLLCLKADGNIGRARYIMSRMENKIKEALV